MPWKEETPIPTDAPSKLVPQEPSGALGEGEQAKAGRHRGTVLILTPCSSSCGSYPKRQHGGEESHWHSWPLGLGQPVSCSTDSSSLDYNVLHRTLPIAWPISFMEGDIVKVPPFTAVMKM